jgi:hypothetical protein
MEFLAQYWYVLAFVVLALAIYLVNHYSKGTARATALRYLLAAEKLVFTTTEAKLSVVADVGYKALPSTVKTLISPLAFEVIVIRAYNEVKELVDKLNPDPIVPTQNTNATDSTSSTPE